MNPRKSQLGRPAAMLAGVLAAMLLAACAQSPTGRNQLVLKSDEALAAEGKRQFEMIRERMPLVKDRATIDYIACVSNSIVDVLEPPSSELYWELAVIDQPDINAFVLPGGKINVFSGILQVAKNQHQLATVIGHEVAHVTAHHANERASRSMVAGVGIDIAAILLGGGYAHQTQAAQQTLQTGAMLGILNPFSRKQESEADVVGLKYMAMAGFDPREAVKLWTNMEEREQTQIPEFMSTHPSGEHRIESLVQQLPAALALYNEAKAQGKAPQCQR
ncbi:MAG TPA: M48 family metallopeptidase [Woeseiaceae bacterium]